MSGYSHTVIVGHLGREPELKYFPDGGAVCNFSVAVSKVWKKNGEKKEKTTWYDVAVWREQGENAAQYLHKGSKVLIDGSIEAQAYINKEGEPVGKLVLTANLVQYLDSKPNGNGGSHSSYEGDDSE